MKTALLGLLVAASCRSGRLPPGPVPPPEPVRSVVFSRTDGSPHGERFLTVVVSTPQVPGVAASFVRLRVVQGRYPGPSLPAKAEKQVVLDLLVRRAGRQLRYWPELGSIAEDGSVPCPAEETPLLDLGDTLHTARKARHQTCHTFLRTERVGVVPLAGTADTLYRYRVATVAASTHLPQVAGLEVDQYLRLRGVVYQVTSGSTQRGFRDEWLTYRGQALLAPMLP